MRFHGLSPDALAFYAELERANSKQWWADNKQRYDENVRGPFEALGAELEPEFGPVKIFRPYRDVRFSADKSPYKTHIGMVTRRPVAHYLQLGAGGMLVGGGLFEATPAALTRFRELVDDSRTTEDLDTVLEEIRGEGFELMTGDAVKTAPRGFSPDHPRIELLRLKRLAIGRSEQPAEWMWHPEAYDEISARWRVVSVWSTWLADALGEIAVIDRARR